MKNKVTLVRLTSLLLAVVILLSSCTSTTMIQSSPSGAKVYLNGEPVGVTPYPYSDTKIVGSTTTVKLVKEGYEPYYNSFSRDEQVDVGAVVAGMFVFFPFIWTMKYKPTHTYELKPESSTEDQMIKTQPKQFIYRSKVERIREFKQLYDEKIITLEEFEKEKKKILDEAEK